MAVFSFSYFFFFFFLNLLGNQLMLVRHVKEDIVNFTLLGADIFVFLCVFLKLFLECIEVTWKVFGPFRYYF